MPATKSYDDLVTEALSADFSGWDFSWLAGRVSQNEPSWDYHSRAAELVADAQSLLDIGTGGGEVVASFAPLPAKAVATEQALGAPPCILSNDSVLDRATHALSEAGFNIVVAREEFLPFRFYDIGALVYHLRAVSWQVPDFDVKTYDTTLRKLDAQIRAKGSFTATDHRYMIEARR